MITRLPSWVEYGTFVLSLIAGCINAIGLLGFEHQSVSHISGTVSHLGAGLLISPVSNTLYLLGIVLAFLVGACVAGFLLHGTTLKLGRHYDTALFIESILLFLSFLLLSNNIHYGHLFASAACGLQNALATTYSGAIIRTTHVTGIFTDLGIMLGTALRGKKSQNDAAPDKRKAKLFLLIIIGFMLGSTLGAALYAKGEFYALLFPTIFCLIVASLYRVYARKYL